MTPEADWGEWTLHEIGRMVSQRYRKTKKAVRTGSIGWGTRIDVCAYINESAWDGMPSDGALELIMPTGLLRLRVNPDAMYSVDLD